MPQLRRGRCGAARHPLVADQTRPQCVRLENGEAGDHSSGTVAEATSDGDARLQAEQAKESNNVGGD